MEQMETEEKDYSNYTMVDAINDQLAEHEVKFEDCKFHFLEFYDCCASLYFDDKNKEWALYPSSMISSNEDEEEKEFDLLAMVKKDEDVGAMLEYLPKDYEYTLFFQIPEIHKAEIYPHLSSDPGCFCVKIESEWLKSGGHVKEASYNRNLFEMPVEVTSIEHLATILNDLDSIGSHYIGVVATSPKVPSIEFYSESFMTLTELLSCSFEDNTLEVIGDPLFDLLKQQKLGILLDVYSHVPEYKENGLKIQNEILKTVHDYMMETVQHPEKENGNNVAVIKSCPESIQHWFIEMVDMWAESKYQGNLSKMWWRVLLDLNVSFDDLHEAYQKIKG